MRAFEKQIKISGKGIHSGEPVAVTIKPSKRRGIFFRRIDIPKSKLIPATYDNVGSVAMQNTTIGNVLGAHVQTIEHLMAALFIAGVDSAIIEIDGPETPILDGSASEFYKLFEKVKTVGRPMRRIVIKKEVIAYRQEIIRQMPPIARMLLWFHNVRLGGRKEDGFVKLAPGNRGLDISATLDYPDKIIGKQSFEYLYDGTDKARKFFLKNIARARTFGKYSEWEYLKARGMGRGADETNVIALNKDGDGTINKLIWADEFVRHKIIDALGDMYTSGGFIIGKMETYKGSHGLNNLVLKKLFSDPSNYDIIDM